MIISVITGKGSPGGSVAAAGMTLSWPRPVLLIEADPAGGSLVLGYAAGTDIGGRNLTGVRVAARRSGMTEAIWANVVTLGENRWLLPGVDTTPQAEAIDYPAVAAALAELDVDVIVDAGRIPAPVRHDFLWATADVVLIATLSTLPGVHAAQIAATVARELMGAAHSAGSDDMTGSVLCSVIVGAGRPYSERDIRTAMSDIAPVAGVLAWDPAAAGALVDALPAPRSITSTPLMCSAAGLAKTLAQQPDTHQGTSRPPIGLVELRREEPTTDVRDTAGAQGPAGVDGPAGLDRIGPGHTGRDRATLDQGAAAVASVRTGGAS